MPVGPARRAPVESWARRVHAQWDLTQPCRRRALSDVSAMQGESGAALSLLASSSYGVLGANTCGEACRYFPASPLTLRGKMHPMCMHIGRLFSMCMLIGFRFDWDTNVHAHWLLCNECACTLFSCFQCVCRLGCFPF